MSLLEPDIWAGQLYGGYWYDAVETRDVVAAATGEPTGDVLGVATQADVQHAAVVAEAAQRDWARTPPSDRAEVLHRAGDVLAQAHAEVTDYLMREAGAVNTFEVERAVAECHESARLPTYSKGEVLPSDQARWSVARRHPVGVVGAVVPFNFALVLGLRCAAPALALGNAVLLTPDVRTAVSGGVTIARIFEEAGLPPGLLHVLPGSRAIGEAMIDDPRVQTISFTGSVREGREVNKRAAPLMKRVHLQLGGNSALVVLDSADPAKSAAAGAFGTYLYQGQICMSTGRHLVHRSLADSYTEALTRRAASLTVGDPATEPVSLGPLIDQEQLDLTHDAVQRSVAMGARVLTGGAPVGRAYPATVITDVTPDMPVWADEVFGPVAPVMAFDTEREAVDLVNATSTGLAVGIIGDVGTAMRMADRIDTGKVHINEQTVDDEPTAPFGGTKASGSAVRFGGASANIEAFTEVQWLTMRSQVADYPSL